MKKFLLTGLIFAALSTKAQSVVKADSAYYLLDTAKTPAPDRLWHTYSEGLVKFYELTVYSSCSPLLDRPTFGYSSRQQKIEVIDDARFKAIKKSSLAELLLHLKQFADEDNGIKPESNKAFYLYIIEPRAKGYTMIKTKLDGSGPRKITY